MDLLIDKISDEEMHLITSFRKIDEDRSDFCDGVFLPNQQWLAYWNQEKDWMKNVFKDGLILKKKIVSTVQDDELIAAMDDLVYSETTKFFGQQLIKRIKEYNPEVEYSGWLPDPMPLSYVISNFLITSMTFINNTYYNYSYDINIPNGKIFKLVKGCKVMKTLGKLAALFGLVNEFEPIRLRHSQIMNQAKIQANLCLSIHPLDYITASFNENGWRSCMHWEDGEYRHGVIEMMNSPYVVVAYLESNHEKIRYFGDEWNSKKWREFFIVHPDCISGIKGYPYWNRELEDVTLNWLKELFDTESNYSEKIITWETGTCAIDVSVHSNVKFDFKCGPSMYNDFYNPNEYHMILARDVDSDYTEIFYSGADECVYCGRLNGYYDNESDIYCNSCIEHYSCCSCGEPITDRHDLVEFNGRYYCYCCYENLPSCSCCQSIIDTSFNEDYYEFVIGPKQEILNEISGENIDADDHEEAFIMDEYENNFCWCSDCLNEFLVKGEREVIERHKYLKYGWYRTVPIVPIDRVNEQGLKRLNRDDVERLLSEASVRENLNLAS